MSETMVRKQVYIRRDQDERLKAAAAATGKTESEIIRGAVDEALPGYAQDASRKLNAWREILADLDEVQSRSPAPMTPYRFNRDEAYAE